MQWGFIPSGDVLLFTFYFHFFFLWLFWGCCFFILAKVFWNVGTLLIQILSADQL